MAEYEETIGDHMGRETATNTLDGFNLVSNIIFITKYFFWNLITADPDDNKFVDCAIAGNADFIVSNDAHFKILRQIQFPKVKVITIEDFLVILQKMENLTSKE